MMPRFNLNIIGFQEFLGLNLLTERTCFNLIHRRDHSVMDV
jgi:hypothetical protein